MHSLDETVCLRVIRRGMPMLDTETLHQILKQIRLELSALIGYYNLRNTLASDPILVKRSSNGFRGYSP